MPLHFEDLDVVSEAKGAKSALIVPCNMCPAPPWLIEKTNHFCEFLKIFSSLHLLKNIFLHFRTDCGIRVFVRRCSRATCPTSGFFVCGLRLDRKNCKNIQGDMTRLLFLAASQLPGQFVIRLDQPIAN